MKSYTALALGLQEAFDPEHEDDVEAWERIARKVLAAMRDQTDHDVIQSDYCEHCPVRRRAVRKIRGPRSNWFLEP